MRGRLSERPSICVLPGRGEHFKTPLCAIGEICYLAPHALKCAPREAVRRRFPAREGIPMQSSIWKLLTAVGIIAIGTLVVLQVQHRLPGLRPPAEQASAEVPAGTGEETTFTPDTTTEFDTVLDETARKAAGSETANLDGVNDPGNPAPPEAEHQTFVSASRTVKKDQLTDEPNPFALEEPGADESDSTPIIPAAQSGNDSTPVLPATFESGTTGQAESSSTDTLKSAPSDEESTPILPVADDANPFPPADNASPAAAREPSGTAQAAPAPTAASSAQTPSAKPEGILFFGKEESSGAKPADGTSANGEKSAAGTKSSPAEAKPADAKPSNFEADSDVPIMMVPEPVPSVTPPSPEKSGRTQAPVSSEPNPFESDAPIKAEPPVPARSAASTEPSPFSSDSDIAIKPAAKTPAAQPRTPVSNGTSAKSNSTEAENPFFNADDSPAAGSPAENNRSVSAPNRDRRITPAGAQQSADSNVFEIDANETARGSNPAARPKPSPRNAQDEDEPLSENPFPPAPVDAGDSRLPAMDDEFPQPEYSRDTTPERTSRPIPEDSRFGDDSPFGGESDLPEAETPSTTRPLPATEDEPSARPGRSGSKLGPAAARTVSEVMRPQLTIQKKAPESAVVGVSHEYKILVSNEGDSPAFDVIVEDELGLAADYISSRPVAEHNQTNGQLSWNFAELAPKETREITVRIKPTGEGTLDGVATVRFKAQVRSATVIKSPKLELELNGPVEVKVGDEVRLEFAIHNRGTGDASDVVLRSVLPPGLRHPEGGDLEYEIETLRAGASEVVDLTVVAAEPGDQIRVSAELTSAGVQVTTSNTDVKVVGAQLSIERLGPEKRFVGRSAQFQNIVTNETNFEATNAMVIEQVPEGMRFISASNGGTYNPDTRRIRWDIARLAPGKQTVLEVELTAETAGEMESMVEITESAGFRTRARENTMVKVEDLHNVTADISRQDKPVAIGEKFGFTITIDNRGTAIARNVEVAVQIPPDIKVLAAGTKDVPGNLVEGRNIVRFNTVQAIRPNEKMTFTIKLQGQAAVKNAVVQGSLKYDEMAEPLIVSESVTVFDDRL